MAETQELLRRVFRTGYRAAFPVPGTSRAGQEAAVVSLVEPGERVLVIENGRFGLLFEEIPRRAAAVPDGVDAAAFRARLLEAHDVEIMGAFGSLAGRVWRIGTMAGNARAAPVLRTLAALADTLGDRARAALGNALAAPGQRFDALAGAPA
jgi:aspartate aminotransferase-like enzyme